MWWFISRLFGAGTFPGLPVPRPKPMPNPGQAWIDRETRYALEAIEAIRKVKAGWMQEAYSSAAEACFTDYLSAYNWAADTFEAA